MNGYCERCDEESDNLTYATRGDMNSPRWCADCMGHGFTYKAIADALASEGISCRQENMGGGCAALVIDNPRGGSIIVGNGEWVVGDPMTEEVYGGIVSVTTESADGIYSGDRDDFTLCNSGFGVVAAVVALLNGGVIDCATVGCEDGEHHVFELEEITRRGFDPCPVFTCPTVGE